MRRINIEKKWLEEVFVGLIVVVWKQDEATAGVLGGGVEIFLGLHQFMKPWVVPSRGSSHQICLYFFKEHLKAKQGRLWFFGAW
jgi:hypothetical protein